jgi:protein phosphatase
VSFSIGAAGRTDRGHRRNENQDCILCEISADGTMGIFAVADGMGGQRAGEVASAITVATLREHLLPLLHEDQPAAAGASPSGTQSLSEVVNEAINRCNERILLHAAAHPETRGLGSTLTLALIKGSLAVIGNIGDSRTYRVRGEAIERLTHDHSLVAHLAAIGQIDPDDVYSHPHRSYIYRALGSESEAQPDIITERLQSGDTLLLCSDGLWEMVRDGDIHHAVDGASSPDEVATRLVAMANSNGGEDNISAIVVKVQ